MHADITYCKLQSAAWQVLFGRTHSPNNEYFKEFQEKWDSTLHMVDFKCLDGKVRNMKLLQDSAISIFKEQLMKKDFLQGDDYKECTELMLTLLGEIPDRGVHWRKHVAFHHARWMSSVIYTAKM